MTNDDFGGMFHVKHWRSTSSACDPRRRTADPPEYIYVLGFSPQKLDGKFHKLKVTFSGPEKLTLQAREGYYALKPGSEK